MIKLLYLHIIPSEVTATSVKVNEFLKSRNIDDICFNSCFSDINSYEIHLNGAHVLPTYG